MWSCVRRFGAAFGALALLSTIPAKADPNWTGTYIGAHAGYGWADWDGNLYSTTHAPPNQDYGFNPSNVTIGDEGWLGGLQIGHNEQFGSLVVGLEIDASKTDLDASGSYININKSFQWDVSTEMQWLGTARARIGWATKDLLLYATGGAAYARTEGDLVVTHLTCQQCPRVSATGSADEDHFGYTVGGGLEWRLTGNWSLKSEYLYVDLGKEDYHFTGEVAAVYGGGPHVTDSFPADLSLHTVRVGINYKLSSN